MQDLVALTVSATLQVESTFCFTSLSGHAFDYLLRVDANREGAFRKHVELMPEVNEIDAGPTCSDKLISLFTHSRPQEDTQAGGQPTRSNHNNCRYQSASDHQHNSTHIAAAAAAAVAVFEAAHCLPDKHNAVRRDDAVFVVVGCHSCPTSTPSNADNGLNK